MPKVHATVKAINKPDWLKTRLPSGREYARTAGIVREHGLHTICSSGLCPNKAECWGRQTATFMILGDVCTRGCRFCATKTGKTMPADLEEPRKIARSVSLMGLRHVVITSVTRDDLPDGGAAIWAATVEAVREANPDTTIEVLIPDMEGKSESLDRILAASPDITGHNIETVERLTPLVRRGAEYGRSLSVLKYISSGGRTAKSGIMVGMGETADEVLRTLDQLRESGCRIVTIGQYLRPTAKHWPVAEYLSPEVFAKYKEEALARGFSYVASAPLVRSSYLAEQALSSCGPEAAAIQ